MRSVLLQVQAELARAREKFPPFHSPHEGIGIIREEFDELWDEIKANGTRNDMATEAIQLAAMAARFVSDLCPEAPARGET